MLQRWGVPALLLAWLVSSRWLDVPVADLLYGWEGGDWSLRHHLLTEDLIHRGGRFLSLLCWLSLGPVTLWSWKDSGAGTWTRPAARLLLAIGLSALVVASLKVTNHVACPWDLTGYGGHRLFVPLFGAHEARVGSGCFPAAHAATGYARVALYYFFLETRSRWRWAGLGAGLLAGLVFGIAQQLRGAHFASHDLASLCVCWAVASGIHRLAQGLRSTGIPA